MTLTAPSPVLVVDDFPLTRAWVARVLNETGAPVHAIADADAAIASALEHGPDVVVINERRLPEGGCGLARRLRADGATAGIVIIGDPDDPELEADALQSGADGVLRWPCGARELVASVQAIGSIGVGRRLRDERASQLDGEMRAAAMIQSALLPVRPDLPAGWTLERAFLPAHDVGGDLVDFISVDASTLVIILADVSGKGVGAAVLAAMAQTAIRGALRHGANPAQALADANALLMDTMDRTGRFLTGFIARIDLASGELTYADAGHGHVALRDGERQWVSIDQGGMPLGLVADADYPLGHAWICPGGLLAAYSDGLIEGGDLEPELARDHLMASLTQGVSAAQLVAAAPADDDRTLVVLGRNG
jgi:sigma-B regulation protein RsbU (phosphoserine phosphatase)